MFHSCCVVLVDMCLLRSCCCLMFLLFNFFLGSDLELLVGTNGFGAEFRIRKFRVVIDVVGEVVVCCCLEVGRDH